MSRDELGMNVTSRYIGRLGHLSSSQSPPPPGPSGRDAVVDAMFEEREEEVLRRDTLSSLWGCASLNQPSMLEAQIPRLQQHTRHLQLHRFYMRCLWGNTIARVLVMSWAHIAVQRAIGRWRAVVACEVTWRRVSDGGALGQLRAILEATRP